MKELIEIKRKPEWLKKPAGNSSETYELKKLLRKSKLNTVCEEARCPNISECFSRGTATFMILGDVCTRGCRFCSVQTGKPHFPQLKFEEEAVSVAEAVLEMGLSHVVVTSVARDDLEDGGASGFSHTINAIREAKPSATIEVLIPDFQGKNSALQVVIDAAPDIINHNLETVPRLYRRVRPGSVYKRSLELLSEVKKSSAKIKTKTGIMLGLGEEKEEVLSLMDDVRNYGIDIFTAGQYMQPSRKHLPVEKYLEISEFDFYRTSAEAKGIAQVFVGPLVRSSYHAEEFI